MSVKTNTSMKGKSYLKPIGTEENENVGKYDLVFQTSNLYGILFIL